MERARQLNLVPGDILFRKVFCYTRKDGDCWVHCVWCGYRYACPNSKRGCCTSF